MFLQNHLLLENSKWLGPLQIAMYIDMPTNCPSWICAMDNISAWLVNTNPNNDFSCSGCTNTCPTCPTKMRYEVFVEKCYCPPDQSQKSACIKYSYDVCYDQNGNRTAIPYSKDIGNSCQQPCVPFGCQ